MRDEDISYPGFILEILHQPQDLSLDRYIEHRSRFIGHHEFRLDIKDAGKPHQRDLDSRDLVGVSCEILANPPDSRDKLYCKGFLLEPVSLLTLTPSSGSVPA